MLLNLDGQFWGRGVRFVRESRWSRAYFPFTVYVVIRYKTMEY
jgi:hypothetical protein